MALAGEVWPAGAEALPQVRGELRGRGAGPAARPAARPRWQQSTALGWTLPPFAPSHTRCLNCCTPLPPLPPSPHNLGSSLVTWTLNKFSPHHHQTMNVSRMYLFIYLLPNCFVWSKSCKLKGEYRNIFTLTYL